MKHRRQQECVYCGCVASPGKDHVPPKAIFTSPRPSDLVTVPCCEACNGAASPDDEYFRLALTVRRDTADHPAAAPLLSAVTRSLNRPQGSSLRSSLLSAIGTVDLRSPAGIIVGRAPAFRPDLIRLNKVAARIVRGLYFHHFGLRVGQEAVLARCTEGAEPDAAVDGSPVAQLIDYTLCGTHVTKGNGAFDYWYRAAEDMPTSVAWLLLFYDTVGFVAIVT